MRSRLLLSLRSLGAAATSLSAACSSAPPTPVPELTPCAKPTPVYREAPHDAFEWIRQGRTGWAVVQFDVLPDGSVRNPQPVEGSPPGTFENAAVGTIANWRFAPSATGHQACRQRFEFKVEPYRKP